MLVGGLGLCEVDVSVWNYNFNLNCHLLHLNTKTKISTKRFMGPGETRRSRHKRDVNCGLIKNINGTKSKLSIKINSAVVSFTPHRPCAFKDTNSEQSKKRKLTCIPQIKPHKGEGFLRHSLSTFCLLLCAQKKVAAWCKYHRCRKFLRRNSNITSAKKDSLMPASINKKNIKLIYTRKEEKHDF